MQTEPTNVDVQRDRGLTVTFDDGTTCAFTNDELRDACPCATCRGLRDQGLPVAGGGPVTIEQAELVGNWGIGIAWSDGHATGIYPWDGLRQWCDGREDGREGDGT